MNRVINLAAFIILTVLWLAFGAALLLNPAALDSVWMWFRGLPLVAQILLGLLLLPVTLGLWIWESSWPLVLRLVLVIGLALVTEYMFFPRSKKT